MLDCLIVGGGPSGLAAALVLNARGAATAVLDPNGGHARLSVEMVPEGAAAIFERLGLGRALSQGRKIADVHSVWGQATHQAHTGVPGLGLHGWAVDRVALGDTMRTRLAAADVPIIPQRFVGAEATDAGWRVSEESGAARLARYVIDATGRPAHVARRLGARSVYGADLVALVWQVPHMERAAMHAEAAPEGWWYVVPGPQSTSLGFVTSAETAKALRGLTPEAVRDRCGGSTALPLEGSGPSWMRDCRSARLDRFHGPGWLATGDAAVAFDPLASQGLFHALSSGFFAGNAMADALEGAEEGLDVYGALMADTAARTHGQAHLQYAARPFDTPFWRDRAQPFSPIAA